jgi:2'-5' RNA ligase
MLAAAHRLFFALVPDAPARQAIESAANDLKAAKLIGGRWVAAGKYHLTIRFLGSYQGLPEDTVQSAKAAAAQMKVAPFDFTLDRVTAFRGRFQSPCVMRCAQDSERMLQTLRDQLGERLPAAEFGQERERRFLPHLTIAYSDRTLAEAIPIAPITSRASELVLISSDAAARYETLARWPLLA